ncbi:MAG: DUF6496 domain-containing protein [Polyangia bacterium]
MPEKRTIERARKDKRAGKSASTQAGEFVRQEIHHIRAGKHGAKSTKQAIAIGLSEARRAGVKIPSRSGGKVSSTTKRTGKVAAKRSRAAQKTLERQPRKAASRRSLSRQAKMVAHKRKSAKSKKR